MNVYKSTKPCVKCEKKDRTFHVKTPDFTGALCLECLWKILPEKPKAKKTPKSEKVMA